MIRPVSEFHSLLQRYISSQTEPRRRRRRTDQDLRHATSRPTTDPSMQYPKRAHAAHAVQVGQVGRRWNGGVSMSRRTWQNDAEEFQRLRDALKQSVGRAQAMRTTGPASDPLTGTPSTSETLNRMVTLLFKLEPSGAD